MKAILVSAFVLLAAAACGVLPDYGPLAQPTRTPTIYRFTGQGDDIAGPFELSAGLVVIVYGYKGDGAFSIRLMDSRGEYIRFVVIGGGDTEGKTLERIPSSGNYLLDINASAGGDWAIGLAQ